jgi:hypothetical protein
VIYTICYSFQGARVTFNHSIEVLSDNEVLYLCLLHAGCPLQGVVPVGGPHMAMRDYAELNGVTNLRWHRALSTQ